MQQQDIEKLYLIISRQTNIPEGEINPSDRFNEDYGVDSIDTASLLHEVNTNFKINIDENEAAKIDSVSDMQKSISKHLKTTN
jgi:acyl carrier protein